MLPLLALFGAAALVVLDEDEPVLVELVVDDPELAEAAEVSMMMLVPKRFINSSL